MLVMHRSNIRFTAQAEVLPSEYSQIMEGHALRSTIVGGAGLAARSNNDTAQFFLGVAAGPARGAYDVVRTEVLLPTAGNLTLPLKRQITGTDISVWEAETGTRLTADSTPENGEFHLGTTTVNGATVTTVIFNAAQADTEMVVMYRTPATQLDVITSWPGHPPTSGPRAEEALGTVPYVMEGTVCVDTFLAAENWNITSNSGVQLKMTTGGMFVPGGSSTQGFVLPNARIVKAPSFDDPFLTIEIQ